MSAVTVNDQNFEQEVEKSNVPVLVDFWAPWCGPCRMLAPLVQEISEEFQGRAKICKLNTDENPNTATRFQIAAIPALIFFKDGKVAEQLTGVRPKPEIKSVLERLI